MRRNHAWDTLSRAAKPPQALSRRSASPKQPASLSHSLALRSRSPLGRHTQFCREAQRRWGGGGLSVRSFSPGFIPSSGLFRAPREDNWLGATAFTVVAGLAGLAVPIDVGGDRLAYCATADDAAIPPGSYLAPTKTGTKGCSREDFDDGIFSKEASDEALAEKLWTLTEAAVAVRGR